MSHFPFLIEYAALFGSIQIFQCLMLNGAELRPPIWIYAIIGANPEIIHIIEENGILPKDKTYKKCLMEAIKCHRNNIANYINNKYIINNEINLKLYPKQILKYYNYAFIDANLIDESLFFSYCKWNHLFFVKYILENQKIDVNQIFSRDFIVEDGSKTYKYPRFERKTALHFAVEKENLEMVKYL